MNEKQKPIEFDPRLEARVRDYVRAGWWVTSRTTTSFIVEKDGERARVYLQEDQVIVDGAALPVITFDGRLRAWALLAAMLAAGLLMAWTVGWIRPV